MKSINKAQKSNCIRKTTNGGFPFLHYLKKLAFTMLALISVCTAALAQSPSLHEQLCGINSEWKTKQIDASLLVATSIVPRDVDLIQKHLELVEGILREKDVDDLSETARKNRLSNLNLLKEYWESALFPVNLYHSERTPYFIDDFGTACAVGYLVIGSGNQDFAEKIRQENNYAYISELNSEYPLLKKWATANGFTIDELAWIQPGYSPPCTSNPCSPGTAIMPSCAFTCDGCYAPVSPSWGCPPYTLISATPFCNLCPGTYSYDITDCTGAMQSYTIVLTAPPVVTAYISKNDNICNGVCDGNATVMPSGGIPPYSYYWSTGDTSKTIDLICAGAYFVSVTDINGCMAVDSVSILEPLPISSSTSTSICSNDSIFLGGAYQNTPGTYYDTSSSTTGCDSVVMTLLSIRNGTSSIISATGCDLYQAPDGQTYSTSGAYTAIISNSVNCDSTITINLTVNNSSTTIATETACDSYTWIDGNTYTVNNDSATYILTNAAGCDSVVTLNLSIETLNASVTTDGNTLTALPEGSAYKWLDCDNAHTPIPGNTNQEYTPTASGTYAATVTSGACIDTTACRSVTLVDIPENTVSDLRIHPNPTTGIINIKGAQGIAMVYDIFGKVVMSSATNSLDMSETARGIYFIRVLDEVGQVHVARVLKE